jgi:hypothetical protein
MSAEVIRMSEHVETGRVVGTIEAAGDVEVERALVGAVSAHNVEMRSAAAGPVLASGDLSIERGGCGPVMCSGNVTITQGGCGPVLAGGEVSITQGGTQSVIAGEARLGGGSFVGVVASPRVTIEDGGRVLLSTPQAAAFGAALGALIGFFMLKRRSG